MQGGYVKAENRERHWGQVFILGPICASLALWHDR